ncbi:hypothetical protein Tco_1288439, partial [Tanacetum coccineum]
DALSVDFDEELYPHMLTAIAGRRWVIGDTPLDVIMASLYLDSDTDEILLEDTIVANISRTEKKKKSRVICHTHGVGSAHHARSDGIPVSVPTVAPQGLQILLADVATQTEDKESLWLLRSKSLPAMFNLDWP